MNLLALEFSTEQRAVCVSTDSENCALTTSSDRSVGPVSMIDSALQKAHVKRDEIAVIAIGLGPGSYTGIRSSIAVAQGFQLAREVKLCGISSVDLIAHSAPTNGNLAVVIDAQRGEFYCATYRRTTDRVERTSDLRILPPDELPRIGATHQIIGPEVNRLLSLGIDVSPNPVQLARLARSNSSFADGGKLEPIYLRPPEFKKAPPPRHIS